MKKNDSNAAILAPPDGSPGNRGTRTGRSAADIKQSLLDNLFFHMGRPPKWATPHDYYMALALTVRDRVLERAKATLERHQHDKVRVVAYLSAEFLPGPHLANNVLNLGIMDETRQALKELGKDLEELCQLEEEPGLGNGGLGRLASCYMDSLATLSVPAVGYGIRYEFGIFDQAFSDGWQVEVTDKWLRFGNAWEIPRPELTFKIPFGGYTEDYADDKGAWRKRWVPDTAVNGIAYDTPICGYGGNACNFLRLWKAEATESFDFAAFNQGDYYRAVQDKLVSENITKVLYPNDEMIQGKNLRLQQQFFFVSCSLQDLLRMHLRQNRPLSEFHKHCAIQLNDTHPAVGVAELMRLLVDVHLMDWDAAWEVTRQTFAYTNHTLLPEALEKWPVELFGKLLPRHLEIIYEINHRFLEEVRAKHPDKPELLCRMSIIDESGGRSVRMANLATVGSHTVNGVARLHSELLKERVMPEFAAYWPKRFTNVTNGVTPRRFMALGNPGLARLITSKIGPGWLSNLDQLRKLEPLASDKSFQEDWRRIKLANKERLARVVEERTGIVLDPSAMFDMQFKRIHEYKRQHLMALHIVSLYLRLRREPDAKIPARAFLFGGKAAPGYYMAKRIIKLINAIGDLVNDDPVIRGRLKVVFFPDFNVKNSQYVYPAADLSEQISMAGKEASGTGNMKFALNGALTIGTLDGANVEIREEVGAENFFLFGMNADEVHDWQDRGYQPGEIIEKNEGLREVLTFIGSGALSNGDRELFRPLLENLAQRDPFMVLADYQAYIECQEQVSALWHRQEAWTVKSILNTARMGKFSSDRSINDYCENIWHVEAGPGGVPAVS